MAVTQLLYALVSTMENLFIFRLDVTTNLRYANLSTLSAAINTNCDFELLGTFVANLFDLGVSRIQDEILLS